MSPDPAAVRQIIEAEAQFSMIRAQGAGGQNVNKVSNAVHLRFDIQASALPEACKAALLESADQRISKDGVVVIKAQAYRSLEQNKADALERLLALVLEASRVDKPRKASRPTYGSRQRRLAGKTQRGQIKQLRGKVQD
ncbi:aminoacyl-tRNA hydrolase [Chitinimonas arctica]|uniref:Aminoacyl-tRNA hydrolase n=1 Tax=Chitinimonas arctica TaxID=2594795 RepID=A0A516SFN9_9NEIS|nr:alternative ribosome rescue aminoacyl-tRNA hydrolase ArfB [Chitinimonas arctica]QDQ26848.1 aminoacyl-tRNA hydrolase [Chitinimonas arctica]